VKPSLTTWVTIDRLFAPASTIARWILEPLTSVPSRGREDAVVMKFFGMGSLIRFLSLCERSGVDLSRMVVLTFAANREVCEMWGVRGIFVGSGSLAEILLGSIKALRTLSRLKPQILIDFERRSNLTAVFRTIASWFASCRSIGFELKNRHSRVCTVYSIEGLDQLGIFLKGIESLPSDDDSPIQTGTYIDTEPGKVLVNINASDLLPARRYGVESFASLIGKLSELYPGHRFYLTGSTDEREYVQRLTDKFNSDKIINVAGRWTLTQFAQELSDCQLFITVDSAPLHLAASMNVATLAIWGPTQPRHFGYAQGSTLHHLTLSLACSPCFLHPKSRPAKACNGTITCMKDLASDVIVAKAIDVITALPSSREVTFPFNFVPRPVNVIA
jgi:hypothetical protein